MCIHLLWIIRPCRKATFTLIWQIVWFFFFWDAWQVKNLLKSFAFFLSKVLFDFINILYYFVWCLSCFVHACLWQVIRLDKKGHYGLAAPFTGYVSSISLCWCMLRFLLTVGNHSNSFRKDCHYNCLTVLYMENVCTVLSSLQVWIQVW